MYTERPLLRTKLQPIQFKTTSREVYDTLRRAILDGMLRPGQRLIEEDLARELASSRTPVREALIMLEFEGLAQRSRRGLEVRTFNRDELKDIYDIRAVLEGYLVECAAGRVTPPDADELSAICAEAEERYRAGFSTQGEQVWWFVQSNRRFHDRIARMVANAKLATMVRDVADLPLLYKAVFWLSPEHVRLSLHYHQTIARAIVERDSSRGALVMREHMYEARDMMLQFLDSPSADAERDALWQMLEAWLTSAERKD